MHAANPISPDPITCSVQQARAMTGLGTTTIYELLKTGRLDSTTIGGRRLIFVSSLKALLAAGASARKAA